MLSITEILARVKISEVYGALTGIEPRRTGADTWRGPAPWRGGDGVNVSGDDSRGIWHDFVDDTGGGILDLVAKIRGGNRADALRWLADFSGIPLSDTPISAEDRARWAAERYQTERDLPDARYWRRAAVDLAEETLSILKASFFDLAAGNKPSGRDLQNVTSMLSRLRAMGDTALMAEYRSWLSDSPHMTALMVRAAKARERTERRALLAYLGFNRQRRAA